ncbi:MAG: TolC family protein [Spirochaetota bacterium]
MNHVLYPHKRVLFILMVLLLGCGGLLLAEASTSRYPEVMSQSDTFQSQRLPGYVELPTEDFLAQWKPRGETVSQAAQRLSALLEGRPSLDGLRSAVAVSRAFVRYTEEQEQLQFSLSTDPVRNPLYRIDYSIPTETGAVPKTLTHASGVQVAAQQLLPTGGRLQLALSHTTRASSPDGDSSWSWRHTPSAEVSLFQPLGAGEGLIDTAYRAKEREKTTLDLESARNNEEKNTEQLILQGLRILNRRQTLAEQLYLAREQFALVELELKEVREDRESGLASEKLVTQKELERDMMQLDIEIVLDNLASAKEDLSEIWGERGVSELLDIQLTVDENTLTALRDRLPESHELYSEILEHDQEYQEALREYRRAEIQHSLRNAATAPQLGLTLNVGPEYEAGTTGMDFAQSVSELFSGSPSVSFSVTFQASELGGSQERLNHTRTESEIESASGKLDSAREQAELYAESALRQLQQLGLRIETAISEYELKAEEQEREMIRRESGGTNERLLQRMEIATKQAAFSVLQQLRELEIAYAELDMNRD